MGRSRGDIVMQGAGGQVVGVVCCASLQPVIHKQERDAEVQR